MPLPRMPAPSSVMLTLWLDAEGRWHASVVMPNGEHLEFDSPFELARWSRGVAAPSPALSDPGQGLR